MSNQSKFNAKLADVNEIMLMYYITRDWNKVNSAGKVREVLKERYRELDKKQFWIQAMRAKEMAKDFLGLCDETKLPSKLDISEVYWVARLEKDFYHQMTGEHQSVNNPTDVLVEFVPGCSPSFFGISAKSTNRKSGICFKNPGIGTLGNELGYDLDSMARNFEDTFFSNVRAPEAIPTLKKEKKKFIRKYPDVQRQTQRAGMQLLEELRDSLYRCYKVRSQNEIRQHFFKIWLDTGREINPRYVKITGRGNKTNNFSAKISDPADNFIVNMLKQGKIGIERSGDTVIVVTVDSQKVFKIRLKYESEKMASAIKLSGEPT